jgi:hypothetical protein
MGVAVISESLPGTRRRDRESNRNEIHAHFTIAIKRSKEPMSDGQ